jgi:hypothetical protein
MSKHKDSKKQKKSSQLVLRVDKAERDAFVSLCEALDTSAAREIRRFMRTWVASNTASPLSDAQEMPEVSEQPESGPVEAGASATEVGADVREAEEISVEAKKPKQGRSVKAE